MNAPTASSTERPAYLPDVPECPARRAERERRAKAARLEREITELAAHIHAATYRLLVLLREFDACDGWSEWGISSCAHWLNWKCGIALGAAREKVRVAHRLPEVPEIAAAFERGELSYSKVRAMTRVATPANEAVLIEYARAATASDLESLVGKYRGVLRTQDAERAREAFEARSLSWRYDDDGMLVLNARLPAEQGAVVVEAIEAAMQALRRGDEGAPAGAGGDVSAETVDESSGTPVTGEVHGAGAGRGVGDVSAETVDKSGPGGKSEQADRTRPRHGRRHVPPEMPFSARRADALALMAETLLASGPHALSTAERFQVLVHVEARSLRDDFDPAVETVCELENGPGLPVATARRLACDASLVSLVRDTNGETLDVGRKTRAIPPAMARALRARDRGCRFPGCTNHRFVDAHHVLHWADGGETRIGNLLTLCRRHHRLVHEGGFAVTLGAGEPVFTRPDGHEVPRVPALPAARHFARDAVIASNTCAGIAIDAGTCDTGAGEGVDYDLAVLGLLGCDGKL